MTALSSNICFRDKVHTKFCLMQSPYCPAFINVWTQLYLFCWKTFQTFSTSKLPVTTTGKKKKVYILDTLDMRNSWICSDVTLRYNTVLCVCFRPFTRNHVYFLALQTLIPGIYLPSTAAAFNFCAWKSTCRDLTHALNIILRHR